jgi:hypothetical protein
MTEKSLQTRYGIWKIQLKDSGELQILDHEGRRVHVSSCHMSTGVHLAMRLADLPPLPPNSVPPGGEWTNTRPDDFAFCGEDGRSLEV